ncbi:MAG TPA: PASTA domain-containing protein [Acidimicrobiales bacterium]|nr:PASTA domain-containing protein [Acidimicrobiales bacterium]
MATSRIADSVGRVLGDRYRLTRPLGTGASAHVYVAEDVSLRRRVAIKVLHEALAGDEGFLRRFRAEAQVVAALRHPNILRVYDWGEDGGSPYLVMELLEGGSLRALLDRGNLLSPAQAASVGAEAARALDYAHRRGLVHRDIKPANLIFDDEGRLSVADFGLARALAEATWTEPAGAVVGTARYAAPEQVRGQSLDSRADVYSLALVLIEATTGAVPFAADTTLGTLMARVERDVEVPEGLGPLGPVLEKAGRSDREQRLDAAGLVDALDKIAAKLPPPAPLPLAAPSPAGLVENDPNPTEYPGRTRLFDVASIEAAEALAGRETAASTKTGPAAAVAGSERRAAHPQAWVPRSEPDDEGPPPGRRRRRWRIAALVLAALLLIGGGTAGALVATSAFTPTHPVPNLVGDSEAQASSLLRPLHLHLTVYQRQYSSRAAGTILAQRPARGSLREGAAIGVLLSLGPQPVNVPTNLANTPLDAAEAAILALGLKVGTITHQTSMTVASGLVISSSPNSGTLLPGQAVNLVVSSGKPTVPVPTLAGTASGQSFAAAQSALQAVGLTAVESDQFSDTVAKGQVIGTNPAAGAQATVGSQVTVLVSKGPDLVAVPNVAGQSVAQASQTLAQAGFNVTGVTGNPNKPVSATSPAANTMVHRGSNVQIITG